MRWYVVVVVGMLLQLNVSVQGADNQRDEIRLFLEYMMNARMDPIWNERKELNQREVSQADDGVNDAETEPENDQPVVATYGGNADGANCVFPFVYNEKTYTTCTTSKNNGILWCATSADYTNDKKWGNCEAIATFGGNSEDGSLCRFPFDYKGTTYNECITEGNNDILWCYTTTGEPTGDKWGNCRAIRTSGGDADGSICRFPFTYNSKEYTSCTTDGSNGVEWCAVTDSYDADQKWGYCRDVATYGGNANGSFCVFPYNYGGSSYSSCTTSGNDGVPWCATTSDYDADKLWGNCRVGGCGYRPIVQEGDRIVGGFDAIYGAFPWTVAIPYKVYGTYSRWCGGTVISDRWILTAAHCFAGDSPSEYLALISNNLYSITDKYEQFLELESLIPHEGYPGSSTDYDIALIKVDGRIYFNNYSQAACLPEEGVDVYHSGAIGIISGWGALKEGSSGPDQLQAAHVPILDQTECASILGGLTPRMVCAGYLEGGIDTCQGDSGGPMVQNISDVYTATGITSWGYGCARPNSPGVYTRVQELLPWIYQTISENS